MAIIQEVKDGKFVDGTSDSSSKKKNERTVNNDMGKDQFLQLLVAQMQYQDPLEPTSNTEWVEQMATFSMVESMNNMMDAMSEQSANDLVGKYVLINDGDKYVKGKVDYVTKQNGETVISVGDKLYGLDKLDTVADEEYFQGSVLADELHQMIKLLPSEENLTANDDGLVKSAREAYEKMTESQKLFVEKEYLDKLKSLELKMNSLKATKYTGMVRQLPSVTDINEADEETLAGYRAQLTEASKYYEDMTDAQKQLVADDTRTRFNTAEAAVTNAEKKFEKPDDTEESKDPVADLLQQILDQLAGNKKEEETENNPDNSNQDSGQGTPETGAAE